METRHKIPDTSSGFLVRNTVNAERQWRPQAELPSFVTWSSQEHGECRKAMETRTSWSSSLSFLAVRNTVNAERQWRPQLMSCGKLLISSSQEHGECRKAMETDLRLLLLGQPQYCQEHGECRKAMETWK